MIKTREVEATVEIKFFTGKDRKQYCSNECEMQKIDENILSRARCTMVGKALVRNWNGSNYQCYRHALCVVLGGP